MKNSILGVCFTLMTLPAAFAGNLTTEQKLSDFRYLLAVINSGYGPLEYKQVQKIMDPQALNTRFEAEITATKSNEEFYYKLVEYIAAYRDGHFGIELPTTKRAHVPVVSDLVDGKVLITKIDRTKLNDSQFPFAVGDEVVAVDGQPIQKFLDSTSKYIGSGSDQTVRRVAAWLVFARRFSRMPGPVESSLKVEIRRGTSAIIESATLPWTFEGESVSQSQGVMHTMSSAPPTGGLNFDRLDNELIERYQHPLADRDFICSGGTRTAIPADATVIMKTPVLAYFHPTAKGNVGYLRIPHYSPPTPAGGNRTETTLAWIAQYEFAIRELEKNTVGLIIDQDHNCGGSVWVVNKMISMFMEKAFAPSQFELLANKESYNSFLIWMAETPENTVERENVQLVLDLVKSTWLKGISRLTPKTAIDGEPMFAANSVRYSKPVVVLIDEMAGSGGDMFPSMMKGLGRAKLFGQTTSGLGGHVNSYPAALPYSQMTMRMTKSLFYRPDGVAIENNGAVADQFYTITRDDMMYGFKNYQKAYVTYLLKQLP